MLNSENDVVNDDNVVDDTSKKEEIEVSTPEVEELENIVTTDVVIESSNDEVSPLIDYLSSEVLEIKTYTYDELNSLESNEKNSDKNKNFSADLYDINLEDVSEKQVVNGTVVAIYDKEVVVDIGFKSEGIIDKTEFATIPEIGEKIDVSFRQMVAAFSIDSFVELFDPPLPNHIKIDVDSTELEILKGAQELLKNGGVKSILIEAYLGPGYSDFYEIKGLLENSGFKASDCEDKLKSGNIIFIR